MQVKGLGIILGVKFQIRVMSVDEARAKNERERSDKHMLNHKQ